MSDDTEIMPTVDEMGRLGKALILANRHISAVETQLAEANKKIGNMVQANPRQLWNLATQELLQENKRLRDALKKYGRHNCARRDFHEAVCTCGLDEALKGGGK